MNRVQITYLPTCFLVDGDGVKECLLSEERANKLLEYANGDARKLYNDAFRAVRVIARGGAWSRLHYEQRHIPRSIAMNANISFNARKWN